MLPTEEKVVETTGTRRNRVCQACATSSSGTAPLVPAISSMRTWRLPRTFFAAPATKARCRSRARRNRSLRAVDHASSDQGEPSSW
ncbi:hypothetical protein ACFXPJ_35290, partial [Streptomyces goshikiensis]